VTYDELLRVMLHAENPCVHFIVTHLVEQIIPDKVD